MKTCLRLREDHDAADMEKSRTDVARDRPVILIDDLGPDGLGYLVSPADTCDADTVNFFTLNARGLVCVAMSAELVDRLSLPMMPRRHRDALAFTVSIEAGEGISTGISAADRAKTIRAAVRPGATFADLRTPGHIFPVRAAANGLREHVGIAEAAVALCHASGRSEAALFCAIMNDEGREADVEELLSMARELDLDALTISEIASDRSVKPFPPEIG